MGNAATNAFRWFANLVTKKKAPEVTAPFIPPVNMSNFDRQQEKFAVAKKAGQNISVMDWFSATPLNDLTDRTALALLAACMPNLTEEEGIFVAEKVKDTWFLGDLQHPASKWHPLFLTLDTLQKHQGPTKIQAMCVKEVIKTAQNGYSAREASGMLGSFLINQKISLPNLERKIARAYIKSINGIDHERVVPASNPRKEEETLIKTACKMSADRIAFKIICKELTKRHDALETPCSAAYWSLSTAGNADGKQEPLEKMLVRLLNANYKRLDDDYMNTKIHLTSIAVTYARPGGILANWGQNIKDKAEDKSLYIGVEDLQKSPALLREHVRNAWETIASTSSQLKP